MTKMKLLCHPLRHQYDKYRGYGLKVMSSNVYQEQTRHNAALLLGFVG
jgi:hypothetical protein